MLRNFLILIVSFLASVQLLASKADWTVQVFSTGQVRVADVVIDEFGNSYSTGMFTDTLFVHAENRTDTLIDKFFGETFIIKMDSCANVIWAKQFFGTSRTEPTTLRLNSKGQIIITGRFSARTDFDPSTNTYFVETAGGNAIYITILDNDGNLINVGRLGGSPGMYSPRVTTDEEDNIYVAAAFSGGFSNNQVDLDPSLTSSLLFRPTGLDGAILKLDSLGKLDWVYHIRGPGFQIFPGDIVADKDGVTASFHFYGQINFDTDNGRQDLQSRNSQYDGLLISLSPSKQLLSYAQLKGTENLVTKAQIRSTAGNFLAGYFSDSMKLSFNNQPLIFTAKGNFDSYLGYFDNNGALQWMQQIACSENAIIHSMNRVTNGNIIVIGNFTDTVSFGTTPNITDLISLNKRNQFIATYDSIGNFIKAEQLDIATSLQNHMTTDANDNIYYFTNFNSANLKLYDGDTSFVSNEKAVLFRLSDQPNRVKLGNDKTFCQGDSVTLQPILEAGDQVVWSNGKTTPTLTVKQAGTYHVKVTNCGRTFRDTINITTVLKPTLSLPKDTAFCDEIDFLITAKAINAKSFKWNTGDTTQNLSVVSPGQYILVADNNSVCSVSDTINIALLNSPIIFNRNEVTFCGTSDVTLDAKNKGSSYVWNTGENTQQIVVNESGVYSVLVDDSYCRAEDSIKITFLDLIDCTPFVSIPNVFTPNDDGINDFLKLELRNIESFEISIYNKWSQLVHQTANKENTWDGRLGGKELPSGSYLLLLTYSYYEFDEALLKTKTEEQTITLLR